MVFHTYAKITIYTTMVFGTYAKTTDVSYSEQFN